MNKELMELVKELIDGFKKLGVLTTLNKYYIIKVNDEEYYLKRKE